MNSNEEVVLNNCQACIACLCPLGGKQSGSGISVTGQQAPSLAPGILPGFLFLSLPY